MRAVFGLALAIGSVALLAWIVAAAVAGSVENWDTVDPDARFGRTGRRVVAAVFGFGMAGLSAAYAGWSAPVALGAAVAGAAVAAGLSGRVP